MSNDPTSHSPGPVIADPTPPVDPAAVIANAKAQVSAALTEVRSRIAAARRQRDAANQSIRDLLDQERTLTRTANSFTERKAKAPAQPAKSTKAAGK